jgi:uncharacterized membrane protein YccF (DUF307 family)
MNAALNFLWLIFGGLIAGVLWLIFSGIMFLCVIGIPWGRAAFNIGLFTFLPFGREAISRRDLTGKDDIGTGSLGLLGNVIWFTLAGLWLAIFHIAAGVACFLSVIGIPFGIAHLKLASVSLAPIGKVIVSKEVAQEARRRRVVAEVDSWRAP